MAPASLTETPQTLARDTVDSPASRVVSAPIANEQSLVARRPRWTPRRPPLPAWQTGALGRLALPAWQTGALGRLALPAWQTGALRRLALPAWQTGALGRLALPAWQTGALRRQALPAWQTGWAFA